MTVGKLISQDVPPLRPHDTVEYALSLLMELRVRHLPVVEESGRLVGIVSESSLLDSDGPDEHVGTLVVGDPVHVTGDQHVFDAAKVIVRHALTSLPVVDRSGLYLGVLKRHEIMDQFARMLSTHESGAILALEVAANDFSLSKLVYAIEQTNARILSIATESPEEPTSPIAITIKLNLSDTSRVRHVLEHQGYRIVASFGEDLDDEEFQSRVEQFLRYLEV